MLRHGHQPSGPENSPDNEGRLQRYQKALLDAGISLPQNMVAPGKFESEGGHIAIDKLLESNARPTAVLAANDEMAIGAIDAAQERSLRVPADLAVIGFDDIQKSALTHSSLTTLRQPMQLLGEAAVTLLFDRLQSSNGLSRHEVLDTKLVIRRSCGCPIPSNSNPYIDLQEVNMT